MKPIIAAGLLIVLTCQTPQAIAGKGHFSEDYWNPEHINQLPPEIRGVLAHMCRRSAKAGHYFATYFDSSHVLKLHFEYFECDSKRAFCSQRGCLHQEYVLAGERYHLLKSYNGPAND